MNEILDARVNLHLKSVLDAERHAAALQAFVEMSREMFDPNLPEEVAPNYVSFRLLAKGEDGTAQAFELAIMRPGAQNPVQVLEELRRQLAERDVHVGRMAQQQVLLLDTIKDLRARVAQLEGSEL